MPFLILALLLWLPPWAVAGAEETQVDVSREKGHYLFRVETVMDSPADQIRTVITDYPNLHLLHDVIQESRLIENTGDRPRVHVLAHPCVLIFCKNLDIVLDLHKQGKDLLIGTMDPQVSDFSSGMMRWEIQPLTPRRTRIVYTADMVPSFWMPPIVGPWLLQIKISNLASEMIQNIGRIAAGEAPKSTEWAEDDSTLEGNQQESW